MPKSLSLFWKPLYAKMLLVYIGWIWINWASENSFCEIDVRNAQTLLQVVNSQKVFSFTFWNASLRSFLEIYIICIDPEVIYRESKYLSWSWFLFRANFCSKAMSSKSKYGLFCILPWLFLEKCSLTLLRLGQGYDTPAHHTNANHIF